MYVLCTLGRFVYKINLLGNCAKNAQKMMMKHKKLDYRIAYDSKSHRIFYPELAL